MGAVPQVTGYPPLQLLCIALRTLWLWYGAPPVWSLCQSTWRLLLQRHCAVWLK